MLSAILFIIRYTGVALAQFLNTPFEFTDEIVLKFYHLIVFLFILPLFLRFLYVILHKSASSPK